MGAATDAAVQTSLVPSNSEDRYASARAHSRLLKADAFHVTVLFTPTLAFLSRVEAILPSGMADTARGPVNFLNEFASEVYLPQLETKVLALFHNAAGGADAFQEDVASGKLSSKPLVKVSRPFLDDDIRLTFLIGKHGTPCSHQFPVRIAHVHPVPQGRVLATYPGSHHPLLPDLLQPFRATRRIAG